MTGLRIGWSTPWNERSAIAHFAGAVGEVLLTRGHAVTILRSEAGDAAAMPARPGPFPILHLDDLDDDALRRRFDVVVAHIGNHQPYHNAQAHRLTRAPEGQGVAVVGIFHDLFLCHLAAGHFEVAGNPMAVLDLTRRLYGDDAVPDGQPFWDDMEAMVRERPMIEWLARRCVAAVAHSGHYLERLRRACPGPVETIPLAFVAPDLPPPPPPCGWLTVAAIGHVNPNKRIDQIILAISASPMLRRRCRVRVIGEATEGERARLIRMAAVLGLEPPAFTGWVTDEELRWQLRDVDVVTCLRNPVLEGASASVITAMASGRPTLVTDHGCYAEIPAGAVMPCRPEAEALDAMRHLETLLARPETGAAIGRCAREVACTRHAPAAYADALLLLLERVVAEGPRHKARQHLLSTLASLGLGASDAAARRVEAMLGEMEI